MKQHSDKYAWAGRTAIIYNIFVDDFFEKIEYKNTSYYSYATILYDYYLKKEYKNNVLYDIGFQYMEVNNPNSLKTYSIKGDEFPEYEHAIISKTTDKMANDNVVYKRGPKSQNDFIFPCKVLVTGLKPATEYIFKRYCVINNEFVFNYETTISTLEDSQNSVSCLGFNFDSSVTENEKKIFEQGIQDACNIMNMMSIFDFHFTAKTQNAKGTSWAAKSNMIYNSQHSSTWNRENLRSTTLHELAHNFLDEDFKGSDVTEFMEFATGIPNATWKWMNIHNYPVISSADYDYIGDCLVAAACQLAPKIKIPDRPVENTWDAEAVDLGLGVQ